MKKDSVTPLHCLMGTCGVRVRKCCSLLTVLFLPLFIFLLLSSSTTAQTTTSTIKGTVTDASGGAIPGAVVKVKGRVQLHRNRVQLSVSQLRIARAEEASRWREASDAGRLLWRAVRVRR